MKSTLIKDFSKPLGTPFPSVYAFYSMAMQYVKKDFSWAEFGTFRGISARIFLQFLSQEKNFYLFDSFEGLPEEWADSKGDEVSPIGTFARQVPEFNDDRAILKVGWFEDTVSPFVKEYKEKGLSFIHIDCDLYSSTKTVLNGVKDLILPETVLIFDEFCGVLRHQEHEYKAFEEFVLENNLEPEYLCSEKKQHKSGAKVEIMNSIKHLKDVHKGKECILLNCGPSLNDFSEEKLKEISKDKVVIAVKQAYLKAPDIVDYHFWNCCNLPTATNGIHYDYSDSKATVIASSNFAYGVRWNLFQKVDYFYKIPLFRLDGDGVFIANALNFENWTYTNNPVQRPIGPGIMYETVVFALEHFGFSRVICIGWDLTYKQLKTGWNQDKKYEHFYDENSEVHNPGYILDWEVEATCKASESLYKWLLSKGVHLEIASDKSSLYKGIPRVKL